MDDVQKLFTGTLYTIGLNGFHNSLVEEIGEAVPFQCFPIYLNDDKALDAVIAQTKNVDLGSALYVPNNVSESNVVWVIFQNLMGIVLNDLMTYQEWRDFIFENDLVLPVNLQVNNHETVDFNTNVNTNWLKSALGNAVNGEVEVSQQGQSVLKFGVVKGQLPISHATPLYQKMYYEEISKPPYKNKPVKVISTSDDVKQYIDYTNHLDIYCYNSRVEVCAIDYNGLTRVLTLLGDAISVNLFNDDYIDTYTELLNQYLDDVNDSDDNVSNYSNITSDVTADADLNLDSERSLFDFLSKIWHNQQVYIGNLRWMFELFVFFIVLNMLMWVWLGNQFIIGGMFSILLISLFSYNFQSLKLSNLTKAQLRLRQFKHYTNLFRFLLMVTGLEIVLNLVFGGLIGLGLNIYLIPVMLIPTVLNCYVAIQLQWLLGDDGHKLDNVKIFMGSLLIGLILSVVIVVYSNMSHPSSSFLIEFRPLFSETLSGLVNRVMNIPGSLLIWFLSTFGLVVVVLGLEFISKILIPKVNDYREKKKYPKINDRHNVFDSDNIFLHPHRYGDLSGYYYIYFDEHRKNHKVIEKEEDVNFKYSIPYKTYKKSLLKKN